MATKLTSLLRKLASPSDRERLDADPSIRTRLRVLGRIGLKFWWAYLIGLVLLTLGTVSTGMDVYHRTEKPQFCGGCHEMSHNYESWAASRHKDITCADCHAQQGAMGWMKTKFAGLRQLTVHFSAKTISAIKVENNQRMVIDSNCRRCHAGLARLKERLSLGVSHRQHLDKGLSCTTCHTGAFTHPTKRPAPSPLPVAEGQTAHGANSALLEARFVDVAQCYTCHDGKTTVDSVTAFSAHDETKCLKCHPDADQALAHGARSPRSANRKPCLDCHEASPEGPHFTVGPKVSPICAKCHQPAPGSATHTPYSSGDCSDCHAIMSPAYLFKTGPRPTTATCLRCHEQLASVLKKGSDEVSSFSNGEADLHRRHADKLGAATGDWCLDCHSPHASDSARGLLRFRAQAAFKSPGTATLTKFAGGSCQGGCHEKDGKVKYTGPS